MFVVGRNRKRKRKFHHWEYDSMAFTLMYTFYHSWIVANIHAEHSIKTSNLAPRPSINVCAMSVFKLYESISINLWCGFHTWFIWKHTHISIEIQLYHHQIFNDVVVHLTVINLQFVFICIPSMSMFDLL